MLARKARAGRTRARLYLRPARCAKEKCLSGAGATSPPEPQSLLQTHSTRGLGATGRAQERAAALAELARDGMSRNQLLGLQRRASGCRAGSPTLTPMPVRNESLASRPAASLRLRPVARSVCGRYRKRSAAGHQPTGPARRARAPVLRHLRTPRTPRDHREGPTRHMSRPVSEKTERPLLHQEISRNLCLRTPTADGLVLGSVASSGARFPAAARWFPADRAHGPAGTSAVLEHSPSEGGTGLLPRGNRQRRAFRNQSADTWAVVSFVRAKVLQRTKSTQT